MIRISCVRERRNLRRTKSVAKLSMILLILRVPLSYLDPGSGSIIIQLLVAAVVGILATFRFWKSRLLSLFCIRQDTSEEDGDDKADED